MIYCLILFIEGLCFIFVLINYFEFMIHNVSFNNINDNNSDISENI